MYFSYILLLLLNFRSIISPSMNKFRFMMANQNEGELNIDQKRKRY